MTRAEERKKATELNVMDARDLIKAKYSALLPLLTAAQIDQVQRQLDADVINAAIEKELEDLDKKSIVGRTSTGQPVRDQNKVATPDKLNKVKKNRIVIRDDDTYIRILDVDKLLAPGALTPNSDNPDEAAFLLRVKSAVAQKGVWFRVYLNQSQMAKTQFADPHDTRRWFANLWLGSDKRDEFKTASGQLTREVILGVPLLGAGFYDYVHNGPTLRLLKNTMNIVSSKIKWIMTVHHDFDPKNGSLRGRALTWAIDKGVGEGMLGLKVDFPDKRIWDEPRQLISKAASLIASGNLLEGNKLIVLAGFQAEWGANALDDYIRFYNAMKPGAKIALNVLQVADTLGDIAEVLLFVRGIGKGLIRLGRGGVTTVVEGGESVAKRQLPAGTQRQLPAGPPSPTVTYENAIKNAEVTIKTSVPNTRTVSSVAPRGQMGVTAADSGPSASRGATPKPNAKMDISKLPLNPKAHARKKAWFNSTGRVAYLQDNRQYVEYVQRELRHLSKVKPNATLAEKTAIIDRADRIWGDWDEAAAVSVKYKLEQINVDIVTGKK